MPYKQYYFNGAEDTNKTAFITKDPHVNNAENVLSGLLAISV